MRSIAIAERILALVTTRERVSSTVGDLAEQIEHRGAFWFWSGILRTAASLVWRDIVESPARMIGLALLALAIDVGSVSLGAFLTGAAGFS